MLTVRGSDATTSYVLCCPSKVRLGTTEIGYLTLRGQMARTRWSDLLLSAKWPRPNGHRICVLFAQTCEFVNVHARNTQRDGAR